MFKWSIGRQEKNPREMKIRERKQKIENKMATIKSSQGLVGAHVNMQTSTQMPGPLNHHFHLPAGPASLLCYMHRLALSLTQVLSAPGGGRAGMSCKLKLALQMTMASFNKAKSTHSPFTFTAVSLEHQCPYSTGSY